MNLHTVSLTHLLFAAVIITDTRVVCLLCNRSQQSADLSRDMSGNNVSSLIPVNTSTVISSQQSSRLLHKLCTRSIQNCSSLLLWASL